jgi:glucose-6-phosphate isomerase
MKQHHAAPTAADRWAICQRAILSVDDLLTVDATEMPCVDRVDWSSALAAMTRLEAGAIANPDEQRAVGHYWLRDPERAPTVAQGTAIVETVSACSDLAQQVFSSLQPTTVLHLGIGGSALGPQLLCEALGGAEAGPSIGRADYKILDNIDPAGIADHLAGVDLETALVVVVSKSGTTAEIQQGLTVLVEAFESSGVRLAARAIAITGPGSILDQRAIDEDWFGRLPIWDFVGGRTSVCSAVGLLPLALLGGDTAAFLAGAAAMDVHTRRPAETNPAVWLAERWLAAQSDRPRSMVVLPYADRLGSLSRYLQQLVMESVGKRLDRSGAERRNGLTVYGNKGSTDQHAYVQQLRDGPDDFFALFIQVLTSPSRSEAADAASDLLFSLLDGTRTALFEDGKSSITLQLPTLDARRLGALIALFERAVGLLAEALDLNAYHQPGVEAGKAAAAETLGAQALLLAELGHEPTTAEALCHRAGLSDPLIAWRTLSRLAALGGRGVARQPGTSPRTDTFSSSPLSLLTTAITPTEIR